MRRTPVLPSLILAVLLAVGLSSCGRESDRSATDPAGGETSQTSEPAGAPSTGPSTTPGDPADTTTPAEVGEDGPVGYTEVAVVTGTEEGGEVSPTPVPLDTEAAVDAFVGQFTGSRLAGEVRAAVEQAPEVGPDQTLVGAIVAIGCDAPTDLSVERVDGEVQVQAMVPKNQVQCFAAMTSVAVLVLDTTELGATPGVS